MLTAKDVGGVMGMMPAFATDDATDINATQTVAVDNLAEGVDRIIKDGIDVISTTGTYGECYNLLWEEFRTITTAAVDTVKKRVPLFIGVTSPNPREVVQKMNFVKDTAADGVLLGVPYYETLPVDDAIRFYHDIADLFPTLNILIYHNPGNHKFTLPVGAFKELVKKPSIIGMKDSHRTTGAFMNLQRITPGPDQRVREPDAVLPPTTAWARPAAGPPKCGWARGRSCTCGTWSGGARTTRPPRSSPTSTSPARASPFRAKASSGPRSTRDYCKVGPTRVPFLNFPDNQIDRAKKRAAHWQEMNERYRPLVEAENGRTAA